MNQVNLVGRVVREPELRKSSSGKSMMFITLAVDGYYDRKKGEVTSDFIPVTLWDKTAERCSKLVKGSLIRITGRVSAGSYTKDGQKRYVTDIIGEEVQFLSKPKGGQ